MGIKGLSQVCDSERAFNILEPSSWEFPTMLSFLYMFLSIDVSLFCRCLQVWQAKGRDESFVEASGRVSNVPPALLYCHSFFRILTAWNKSYLFTWWNPHKYWMLGINLFCVSIWMFSCQVDCTLSKASFIFLQNSFVFLSAEFESLHYRGRRSGFFNIYININIIWVSYYYGLLATVAYGNDE